MAKHAKLSASGSHRWLYCPGSVAAESELANTTSIYAQEGTAAHELAELALTELGGDCSAMLGKPLPENQQFVVTNEMADYVQIYVDYVRGFSGQHLYEQRTDFSEWVPEGFGTADAVIIEADTIRVIDLKYGMGLRVYAEENTQGILYALGAYSEHELYNDFKKVVISIVQPRLDHIDEWEITIPELLKRGEWIRQRAEEALSKNAKRSASESACNWCKAKATCPELLKVTHAAVIGDFEALDLTPVNNLTQEQLRQALDAKSLIVGWLDAVEQHAKTLLEEGKGFAGYKLVNGRSSRSWSDEAAATKLLTEHLKEAAFEKKLLSVAKAEKALKKGERDLINDLVLKSVGKPTLVPESDKRPSILTAASDFDSFD